MRSIRSKSALYTLLRATTRRSLGLLLVLFAVCYGLFQLRHARLGVEEKVPDVRVGYTAQDVADFFSLVDPASRRLYAWTQVTLDVVFPVIYGLLLLLAIAALYDEKPALWLMGLPLLAVASDLLENGLLAYLAFTFEEAASPLGRVASLCTSTKFALLGLSFIVLLPGLIAYLSSKRRPRSTPTSSQK